MLKKIKYGTIFCGRTNVFLERTKVKPMADHNKYYVVTEKAVPDVLLKVVEAKKLLATQKLDTVQEAVDAVGISRSSFYKYKDDIFPIHEKIQGKTITFVMEMEDRPGLLSNVLKVVAESNANVLSIH